MGSPGTTCGLQEGVRSQGLPVWLTGAQGKERGLLTSAASVGASLGQGRWGEGEGPPPANSRLKLGYRRTLRAGELPAFLGTLRLQTPLSLTENPGRNQKRQSGGGGAREPPQLGNSCSGPAPHPQGRECQSWPGLSRDAGAGSVVKNTQEPGQLP